MKITVDSTILEGYPDALVASKLKILEQNGLSLPHTVELPTGISFGLTKLMPLLRICLMREMENYFYDAKLVGTGMISVRNESEALSTLLRLLLNFPASPERDWQLDHLKTVSDQLCTPATTIEPASQPSEADAAKLSRFYEWLKSAGVPVNWAVVDFPSTGRGVQALTGFEPGQQVIEIPRRLLLSPEQARASTTVGAVFRQLDTLEDDVILLLFVLYEKNVNPSSFWRPYFDTLPAIRTPLLYDLSAFSLLEGTLLLEEIVTARQQLQELHDQLVPQLAAAFPEVFVPDKFTYEDFLWVRALFDSRAMKLRLGDELVNCAVPMVDMFNHHPFTPISSKRGFDECTQSLKMHTFAACPAHSQLFISYGAHQSWELLLYYNFLIADNPYDYYSLLLGLDEADPWWEQKQSIAESWDLRPEIFLRKGQLAERTLATLRVQVATNIEQLRDLNENPLRACGRENEADALAALLSLIERVLSQVFPRSLDEDRQLLTDADADQTLCLRFVISQKEILLDSRAAVEQRLAAL